MRKIDGLLKFLHENLRWKKPDIEIYVSDGEAEFKRGELNEGFSIIETVNIVISQTDIEHKIILYYLVKFFKEQFPIHDGKIQYSVAHLNSSQQDLHFQIKMMEINQVVQDEIKTTIEAPQMPKIFETYERKKDVDYSYQGDSDD